MCLLVVLMSLWAGVKGFLLSYIDRVQCKYLDCQHYKSFLCSFILTQGQNLPCHHVLVDSKKGSDFLLNPFMLKLLDRVKTGFLNGRILV